VAKWLDRSMCHLTRGSPWVKITLCKMWDGSAKLFVCVSFRFLVTLAESKILSVSGTTLVPFCGGGQVVSIMKIAVNLKPIMEARGVRKFAFC